MKRWIENHPFLVSTLGLIILTALVYLPKAMEFGLYNDDWYLIYDASTQGPAFFHEVYRSDRPARAYLLQITYSIFGNQIIYYHLTAWLYRALAGAVFFWALHKIWPHRNAIHLAAAALFTIYPGFLSQTNPIDYQAQIFSLFLAMLSLALTITALQSASLPGRILATSGAILSGWGYMALVEYFIGLEALRLAWIVAARLPEKQISLKPCIRNLVRQGLPFALAPVGFLFWRIFLFQSERRATDISAQLSQLFTSPLTGLWWMVKLLQNSLMAIFLAWGVPLYNLAFSLRLRDSLIGGTLSVLIALTVVWFISQAEENTSSKSAPNDSNLPLMIVGVLATLAGLLPIILANRSADFSNYSRYLLASATGGVILITTLIWQISNHHIRRIILGLLIFSATFTHYANSIQAEAIARNQRNFWWQVTWRAPDIKNETTLIASYPVGAIQEDYFVWGPANLIYRHQKQNARPIQIQIAAVVLTDDVVLQILQGKGQETQIRRGNQVTRSFDNLLILTQPTPHSCVRLLNGHSPELSTLDEHRIMLIAHASKLENILPSTAPPIPPISIFGPEPPHDWCYYYQKADLARQLGEWQTVIQLGEQALAEGHYPSDKIEWLPFMQAYTVLGQPEKLRRFVSIMAESPYIQSQACAILSASAADPATLTYIKESFCK